MMENFIARSSPFRRGRDFIGPDHATGKGRMLSMKKITYQMFYGVLRSEQEPRFLPNRDCFVQSIGPASRLKLGNAFDIGSSNGLRDSRFRTQPGAGLRGW